MGDGSRYALIVVGAQDFCISRGNSYDAELQTAAENASKALEHARSTNDPCIVHIAISNTPTSGVLNGCERDAFLSKSGSLGYKGGFIPTLGEGLLLIENWNPFIDNDLESYLNKKGIQEIYVVGFHTSCCVQELAESAIEKGFKVNVVEDATASVSASRTADGLKNICDAGGTIISVGDFRRVLYPENSICPGPSNPLFAPN